MIGVYTKELGFGNILFMLAAAHSYRRKRVLFTFKHDSVVCDSDILRIAPLFDQLPATLVDNLPKEQYHDPAMTFKYIPPNLPEDITLAYGPGYFQSINHFDGYEMHNILRELFQPSFTVEHAIRLRYPGLLKEKTAAVHVRRGNYTTLPNHHPVLPIDYYREAISKLPSDISRIIVCSNDRRWCEDNFGFDSRVIIHKPWAPEEHDGWNQSRWNWLNGIDMYLMAACHHQIIANSTFSWWSAYLSQYEGMKIAPSKWFGPAYPQDVSIIPKDWTVIDV